MKIIQIRSQAEPSKIGPSLQIWEYLVKNLLEYSLFQINNLFYKKLHIGDGRDISPTGKKHNK